MKAIEKFEFQEETQHGTRVTPVRVLNRGGAPWYVVRDIYNAVGINSNSLSLIKTLGDEDWDTAPLRTRGGLQPTRIVSETGLISVVERMGKKATRLFKPWMYEVLIPAGRALIAEKLTAAQSNAVVPEAVKVEAPMPAPAPFRPAFMKPVPPTMSPSKILVEAFMRGGPDAIKPALLAYINSAYLLPEETEPGVAEPIDAMIVQKAAAPVAAEPAPAEVVAPVPVEALGDAPGAKLFVWEGGARVRVVPVDGEPWFVAKDVCEALGLSDVSKACTTLDPDEKGITTGNTLGGSQNMLTISESGLYVLIGQSRKPEARAFRRWVCGTVLPSIRKTGGYGVAAISYDDPEHLLKLTADWVASKREAKRLAAQAQQLTEENQALTAASEKKDNMIASRDQVIEATCSALSKVQPLGRVTCRQYDHRF